MSLSSLRELLEPLERTLLGFDLETTGTNKKTARIIEIGLEIMAPGQPTRHYRTLVNPTIPIPHEATYGNGRDYPGHGITDNMVSQAPTFAQLAPSLIKGFTDADFVGYNIRFDVGIIAAEFMRAGVLWFNEDARLVCGHRLWQVAQPRSLEDFAREYMDPDEMKASSEGAHNALGDVKWSTASVAGLLEAYVERPLTHNVLLPRTVQALHDTCWPDWFDAEGKLRWRSGELCIAFGEHRDVPLREVPEGYRRWMLKPGRDFSAKVCATVRDSLAGNYPPVPDRLRAKEIHEETELS